MNIIQAYLANKAATYAQGVKLYAKYSSNRSQIRLFQQILQRSRQREPNQHYVNQLKNCLKIVALNASIPDAEYSSKLTATPSEVIIKPVPKPKPTETVSVAHDFNHGRQPKPKEDVIITKDETEAKLLRQINYYRNQRIIISNALCDEEMDHGKAQIMVADAKAFQTQMAQAIKAHRIYMATGVVATLTDTDTDIEQLWDLDKLTKLLANARSNISRANKQIPLNQNRINKWGNRIKRLKHQISLVKNNNTNA